MGCGPRRRLRRRLFGLTSLVLAWFQEVEGVAGPVTELGYGVLFGIIQTTGLLMQLRGPERKIAGVQQAFLVIPALVIGSAIASDSQNLVPALILLPAIGILLALHPAREEFFRRGAAPSRTLLAITVVAGVPLVVYALDMGTQARDLAGPPHHVQRLSTMAAMAVAIVLTGLLAALQTRGWRIPAWSAGVAAILFGLAEAVISHQPLRDDPVLGEKDERASSLRCSTRPMTGTRTMCVLGSPDAVTHATDHPLATET
jgi:hypothetical protein